MIKLALADLRESWLAWGGVSLAFVVTNFGFALCMMLSATGRAAPKIPDQDDPTLLVVNADANMIMGVFVGLAVIGASTALVVASRRGAIARLLLAGADPNQIVGMLSTQLVLTSLASAVLGDVLAFAFVPATVRMIATDRGFPVPRTVFWITGVLIANLFCVLLAVTGGWRQARRASTIPPVEALRQATGGGQKPLGRGAVVLRVAGALGCLAFLAILLAFIRVARKELSRGELSANISQVSMFSLVLTGAAISCLAPMLVRPLVAGWTSLVPGGPVWHLARNAVIARSDRLVRTVIPVMFAIGLMFGLTAFTASASATMAKAFNLQLSGASATTVFTVIGLVLIIAVAGAVGTLVMMSRQRDAELALAGLSGATPRQQATIPVLEGVIVTVTGTLLGLVMTAVCLVCFKLLETTVVPDVVLALPAKTFLGTFGVALVTVVLAIVLPTMGSLRKPAPRVIATLVAE